MKKKTETPGDVIIELRNVRKSFDGQVVHDALNLKVHRGVSTIVVGSSGVGKSVMLKYILGFLKPDSGQVLVDGNDITQLSAGELQKLRSRYGVVFQGAALFDSLTVFDNVALPLREKTKMTESDIRTKVMDMLVTMQIENSAQKMPSEISGGMQRRVALARALQLDPEIVLFDEPTTGLDPETSENIYDLFAETHARLSYTALMVTHDIPRIFRIADEIAVLYEGKMQSGIKPQQARSAAHPWLKKIMSYEMRDKNEIRARIAKGKGKSK